MKTILIIEDDTALLENTAELLELENFKVLTASNGADGVRLATINIPDLIVCDIMMPKQDGYTVLKKLSLNKTTQNIPFIFLSAKTERKEIRLGMDLGADDYITKPFENEELISSINSRLAKAKLLNKTTAPLDQGKYKDLNDLKNYFDDYGELSNYTKGDIIYQEGDRANKVFLVLKGLIKTHKMDQNGKELITAIQKPDDFIGFTSFVDNNTYEESATVVEDVELAVIYKNALKELLAGSSNLSLELMNVLTANLSITKDQLLQMAYSSVQRKTARTILQFAEVLDRGLLGEIKISRNDLASVAGIAPESLIRTLSSFKKKGFVEIEGRNIKILKLVELQNLE
jgi:DNA-binding response OmpR family regulator